MGTLLSNAYDSGSGAMRRTTTSKTISLAKKASSSTKKSSSKKSSSKSSSSKKSSSKSSSSSSSDEEIDWIEVLLDRWERFVDNLNTTAESIYKKLGVRIEAADKEIEAITNEIRLEYAAYDKYIEKANSIKLSDTLKQKVRDGAIEISKYNKSTQELINKYKEWYEKALDASDAIDDLHESLADLYSSRFDMLETHFENRISLVEHKIQAYNNDIDNIIERGYLESTKYYEAIIQDEEHNLETLNSELKELVYAMSEGMNSGEIKHGSEAWFDMQQRINDVKEAIQETELSVIEAGNTIRQVKWDNFEYLQDLISNITGESEFLIELMSTSDLFEKNGMVTNTGMATFGLHAQNYNVYMNQADRYAEQIMDISEQLANNPYDTKMIEQREEFLKLQRESILNAEDEKQAIVDLTEDGIKKELEYLSDLIDAYKDSIDSAKDLYDYQKRVKEQASEITKLQKQLAAYANDTSEENRSRVQKLKVELDDAVESLQETQYDRSISAQKEMLDRFYDAYEELLNGRLDNIDLLISETIDAINANSSSINDTIVEQSENVGYTISDNSASIWRDGGEASIVVTKYGEEFAREITRVNDTLNNIAIYVANMVKNSDTEASSDIAKTTGYTAKQDTNTKNTSNISSSDGAVVSTSGNTKATSTSSSSSSKAKSTKSTSKSSGSITKGSTINASGAKIYSYAGGQGYSQYFAKDPIYKVLKVSNGWVQVRHHSLSSGVTGWFKTSNVKKYKLGGLVDYTGLAQVDGTPTRPEAFLNADDTSMMTALIDTLRKISDGKMSILGGMNANSIIDDITKVSDHRNIGRGTTIGDISYEINIPIDHVEDYGDFMNKMRSDRRFETMIQDMTIGRAVGKSKLGKNKYSWK